MKVKIAQLIVTKNIQVNLKKILNVLASAGENEWVIFPEGMLSGYYPEEENFLQSLNTNEINNGITKIKSLVAERKCQCIFGTAYFSSNKWYNASVFLDANKEIIYYKNNLATLDRKCFQQGNNLNVYESQGIKFGIQMCRELVFPEQWKLLKQRGAQVIFHINNSIKESDEVRSHLLFARAFENQYFVCSVNNADKPQKMPSWVVSPIGDTLFESISQQEQVESVEIDLNQVHTVYLQQERTDLVKITTNKE